MPLLHLMLTWGAASPARMLRGFSHSLLHLLLTGGALTVWTGGILLLLWGRRRYQRLTDVPLDAAELAAVPALSILVPACNEADTIERAMQSLLAQDYPDVEIIAVNDRSTDQTGAIFGQDSSGKLASARPAY